MEKGLLLHGSYPETRCLSESCPLGGNLHAWMILRSDRHPTDSNVPRENAIKKPSGHFLLEISRRHLGSTVLQIHPCWKVVGGHGELDWLETSLARYATTSTGTSQLVPTRPVDACTGGECITNISNCPPKCYISTVLA